MTSSIRSKIAYLGILILIAALAFLCVNGCKSSKPEKVVTKEIVDDRSNNSFVFVNEDGTLTTVVYADAVNFQDGEGNWRHVDTTIKDFHTTATPFRAKFGKKGRLSFLFEDELVEFVPLDSKLVQGIVAENRIIYSNLYPNTDLKYTVEPSRLKEEIILKNPKAPKSFIFAIIYEGDVPTIKDKAMDFGSFRTMPPVAIDAKGRHGNVAIDIRKVGGKTCLVIGVDPDWADLAEYPIVIDPTIIIQPDNLTGKDTYVERSLPDSNFGDQETMKVSGSAENARAYLEYDLESIPVYSAISQAFLKVHVSSSSLDSIMARRVLENWEQSFSTASANVITWDSQPRFGELVGSTSSVVAGDWLTVDITDTVRDWVKKRINNYGLVLLADEVSGSGQATMYSSNYSTDPLLRPKLEVTYTLENQAPISKIESVKLGDHVRGSQLKLSGSANDGELGSGISRVDISTNGGSAWEPASGTGSWSYIWTLPADGPCTIRSRAVDLAGNVEETPLEVEVTVDNMPPQAEISSPTDGEIITGKVYVQGTAFDGNLDNYIVEYGEGASPQEFTKLGSIHTEPVNAGLLEFANPVSMNGTYTIALTATDLAGNVTRVSKLVTLQNHVQASTTPHGSFEADTDLCALCHRNHVALSGSLNYWIEPEATYCYSCHHGITNADNIMAAVDESTSHHPIRDRRFIEDPNHTMDCDTCHDPHGNRKSESMSHPADGAVDVPVDTFITVKFTEDMNAASIDSDSFVLTDASGNIVSSTVSYNESTKTATSIPNKNFLVSTSYTATVTTGVKDLIGNSMAQDYTFSFTTKGL